MVQKQKEISRIRLNDHSELVATVVADEKLDLRLFVKTSRYSGPTKSGIRFYLFDGIWDQFKKLIKKVDQEVKELE